MSAKKDPKPPKGYRIVHPVPPDCVWPDDMVFCHCCTEDGWTLHAGEYVEWIYVRGGQIKVARPVQSRRDAPMRGGKRRGE